MRAWPVARIAQHHERRSLICSLRSIKDYSNQNPSRAPRAATRAEVLCSRARRVRIHLTRCLQLRTRAKGSLVRVTCISTWLGEHQRLCKRSKRADNKLDKEKRNVRFEPRADRDLIKST